VNECEALLLGMVGVIVARAAGWLTLNDALTRGRGLHSSTFQLDLSRF